jgi:hypothetical protein
MEGMPDWLQTVASGTRQRHSGRGADLFGNPTAPTPGDLPFRSACRAGLSLLVRAHPRGLRTALGA